MSDDAPAAAPAAPASPTTESSSTAPVEGGGSPGEGGDAPPPAEAPAGETKAEAVRRLNGIAARNKKLRAEQDAFRAERAAFDQERASMTQERARLAEFEAVRKDPSKLFEWAHNNGVPMEQAIEAYSNASDPAKRADMEQRRAKEAEESRIKALEDKLRAQEELTVRQQREHAEGEYLKLFEDRSTFEASRLVFTKTERVAKGNELANRLEHHNRTARPEDRIVWDLKMVAEAVEELARRDERYAEYKASRPHATPSESTPAASPPGTSSAPPGTRAKATLTSKDSAESARVNEDLSGLSLSERTRRASLLKGS